MLSACFAFQNFSAQSSFVEKFAEVSVRKLVKFLWSVELDDVASVKHKDSVTINDGVESVCNCQNCTIVKL